MNDNSNSYWIWLIPLLIGWFLGIISNIVNERLKRRSTKSDIKNGIKVELGELKIHLTSTCLLSTFAINGYNREFYNWIKPHYLKVVESAQSIITSYLGSNPPKMTDLSDDQLFEVIKIAHTNEQSPDKPKSSTFQNVITPFLDSKIDSISLFNSNTQKSLIILKRDINFLNKDAEQIWFYHSKTFDQLSQNNITIVNKNLNELYGKISRRSKIMIDNLGKLLSSIN